MSFPFPCLDFKSIRVFVEIVLHTIANCFKNKTSSTPKFFYLFGSKKNLHENEPYGRYRMYCNSTREVNPLRSTEPQCLIHTCDLIIKPESRVKGAL